MDVVAEADVAVVVGIPELDKVMDMDIPRPIPIIMVQVLNKLTIGSSPALLEVVLGTTVIVDLFLQAAPDFRDALHQTVIGHKGLAPDLLKHRLFGHNITHVIDKIGQHIRTLTS